MQTVDARTRSHWNLTASLLGLLLIAVSAPALRADDNGYVVDPYIQGCDTASGCSSTSVPWSVVRHRCADADGCTMRISIETSLDARRAGPVVSFGINDAGSDWSVTTSFTTLFFGENGDGNGETVTSFSFGLAGGCGFRDDPVARPTELSFELLTVDAISGTLECFIRIDD